MLTSRIKSVRASNLSWRTETQKLTTKMKKISEKNLFNTLGLERENQDSVFAAFTEIHLLLLP